MVATDPGVIDDVINTHFFPDGRHLAVASEWPVRVNGRGPGANGIR